MERRNTYYENFRTGVFYNIIFYYNELCLKRDKTNLNNRRGIALISVPFKILSKACLLNIETLTEQKLVAYQCSFSTRCDLNTKHFWSQIGIILIKEQNKSGS